MDTQTLPSVRQLVASVIVAALVGGVVIFGMPAPAMAAKIDKFAPEHLTGYKIATDISKGATGYDPKKPAAYWTGSSWITQDMWAADNVKAMQQGLTSYQATPAVGKITAAQNRAGRKAQTLLLTPEKVAEAKAKYKLPAFSAGPLIKTVGGAATGFTGYAIGAQVGAAGTTLFGLDANGLVCEADSTGFLSVLSGQDCSEFGAMDGFVPNEDAEGGLTMTYGGITFSGTWAGLAGTASLPNGRACFQGKTADYTVGLQYRDAAGKERFAYVWNKTEADDRYSICDGAALNASVIDGYGKTMPAVQTELMATKLLCLGDLDDVSVNGCKGAKSSPFEEGEATPTRWLSCELQGDDGQTYSAQTETFMETDGSWPVPECPALPEGVNPLNMKITEEGGDKSNVLADRPVDEAYRDTVAAYPECQTGLCVLDLVRVSDGQSCFDVGQGCDGWFQDDSKKSKYSCVYGTHDLELSACNVYAQVFDPAKRAAGTPYADPTTGADTGIVTGPRADGEAFRKPVQDPGGMRECVGSGQGSATNAISWVMVPVQCALEWAFVPRPEVVIVSSTKTVDSWNSTAPVVVVGAITAMAPSANMTGCEGIPYDLGGISEYFPDISGTFGNACSGALAKAADWTRLILGLFIVGAGILAIRAYAGRTVGFDGAAA